MKSFIYDRFCDKNIESFSHNNNLELLYCVNETTTDVKRFQTLNQKYILTLYKTLGFFFFISMFYTTNEIFKLYH